MKESDERTRRHAASVRRARAAIVRDEEALQRAQERLDFREVTLLEKVLRNRRAYLAELLAAAQPHGRALPQPTDSEAS